MYIPLDGGPFQSCFCSDHSCRRLPRADVSRKRYTAIYLRLHEGSAISHSLHTTVTLIVRCVTHQYHAFRALVISTQSEGTAGKGAAHQILRVK